MSFRSTSCRRRKAEGSGQKARQAWAEGRRQRAEGRRQKAEGRKNAAGSDQHPTARRLPPTAYRLLPTPYCLPLQLLPGDAPPEQTGFDLGGLTDEQFWQAAEHRIYEALRAYAEQAENGSGFRRRLFADDAAQGFAFIDLCRKRYDVVVMNPPFGAASTCSKDYIAKAYPRSKNDLLAACVERGVHWLHPGALLGAITSRTAFFLTSYRQWRQGVVLGEAKPVVMADLGYGVMDAAMVEAAAYVLRKQSLRLFDSRQYANEIDDMARFKQLTVRGFRRLMDVDVELRPLTVMIGVNGVGKSSLLESLSLLSSSAQGKLRERVSEMGGLTALMTIDKATGLTLGTQMEVEGDAPLSYSITLAPSGAAYTIQEELLCQQRNPTPPPFKHIESRGEDVRYCDPDRGVLTRPTWDHSPLESSLSQVPKMFQRPEELRRRLASAPIYHVLDVSARAPVRLPQTMQPADLPGADGETLVSCLHYLRETDRDRFEAIEDALHAAFPSFERLELPPVAAGTLAMAWSDRAFTRSSLYTHQLSAGTLRFLWLVTLLQSPGLPSICMIDGPEVSLHPEMLGLLADLLREASSRALVVVATHSDRLVRFLKPEEVLVVDMKEDGTASATWADDLELDAWLDEYTLDEVWRMGRMGGALDACQDEEPTAETQSKARCSTMSARLTTMRGAQ